MSNVLTLRRVRSATAVGLLAAIGLAFGAVPAGAGVSNQFTATPTTLVAGGSIDAASVTACHGDTVDLALTPGWVDAFTVPTSASVASTSTAPDGDGIWSTSIAVPADTAADSYTLRAVCETDGTFAYPNIKITVKAPETTTEAPTTTMSATTSPSSTTTTPPAQAAPATAVKSTPTYTG